MEGMSIQERYNDISEISGLSEDIIRRVYKASRQSIAKSLKQGERATIPGLFTAIPEIRSKINIGGESVTKYIKIKATVSPALATELEKQQSFDRKDSGDEENIEWMDKLNFNEGAKPCRYNPNSKSDGIITKQISALL